MQEVHSLCQSNVVKSHNYYDLEGKPAGGYAHGPGMCIAWQDGPRGKDVVGHLLPANGAFVEDALLAAHQRLAFFQRSEFAHPRNAEAMEHIYKAIQCLDTRARERHERGVLGSNVV